MAIRVETVIYRRQAMRMKNRMHRQEGKSTAAGKKLLLTVSSLTPMAV